MRIWLFCFLAILGYASPGLGASSGKIIKVLPNYLDLEGRQSISPSLYDRDAYQAKLRRNPKERSGMRFDVQWRAQGSGESKLRIELRGGLGKETTHAKLEAPAPHRGSTSKWTRLTFSGEDYKKFGELVAWRVTLWQGDTMIGEEKSFLW